MDTVEDELVLEPLKESTDDAKTSADTLAPMTDGHALLSGLDVEEIAKLIINTPYSNVEKVQLIKAAVAEGRYEIDSQRIAEAIMAFSGSKEEPETA